MDTIESPWLPLDWAEVWSISRSYKAAIFQTEHNKESEYELQNSIIHGIETHSVT